MTDLTEKLAEVIGKNVSQSPRGIAHAIIAALPDMVQPLQWDDYPINGEPVVSRALIQGGGYFICDDTDDFTGMYCEFISCRDATWYGSVSASTVVICDHQHIDEPSQIKAAADAHHRARIMAALGVDAVAMKEGKDA